MVTPAPTPSPSAGPSTKKTKSIEDVTSDAAKNAAPGVPQGATSGAKGLDGRPLQSPIVTSVEQWRAPLLPGVEPTVTKYTQYYRGSGSAWFTTLKNTERADFLSKLSQIPGTYGKGKALSPENLVALASSGTMIPPRPEDIEAIEKVMLYADRVGYNVEQAINYLSANPTVASAYFSGTTGAGKGKKINLTPADALALELEQTMLDYLDVDASKKEKQAYAKMVNSLETKRGGALSSLERQQLLIDTVQNRAKELFKSEAETEDSMLLRRGALGATYQLLRENYSDYGLPVDDKTLYKEAVNSIRSKQALENTLNNIKLRAEVTMPALKEYIRQGLTPKKALGNYISLKSKLYGVPEEEITLDSIAPVWSGEKLMAYNDWQKYLYTQPEFKKTQLYGEQRLNDASALIDNFIGRV